MTEAMLKYFSPPVTTSNELSKSPSETTIAKSLKRKSPLSSPQMNLRRNLFKSASENHETSIAVIEEETVEKHDKKIKPAQNFTVVETTLKLSSLTEKTKLEAGKFPTKTSPDINERFELRESQDPPTL